ncbi:MAG TPA: hypothetical protein VH816_00330 [Gaiellaceae bacterium]
MLVVSAWADGGHFRARITCTPDVTAASASETVAGSPEDVVRAVEEWLRGIAGGDGPVTAA